MGFFDKLKGALGGSGDSKSGNDFKSLERKINGNSNISLSNDYKLKNNEKGSYEDGIEITGNYITIDGNGHTISGNNLSRIFHIKGKNITLKNITFERGNARLGGAILVERDAKLSIENCTFINNHATSDGGAIRSYGEVSVKKTQFKDNLADQYGGAILNYTELYVENCDFIHNKTTESDGGAIYNDANIVVKSSDFKDNYAGRKGNAICSVRGGTSKISDSIFDGRRNGEVYGDEEPEIRDCRFTDGTVSSSSSSSAGSDDRNFTYLNNLIQNQRNITLDDDINLEGFEESRFKDGIKISSSNITIDGCGHKINAHGNARIFEIESTGITFKNIIFEGGYAKFGAAIETNRDTSCKIENCQFIKNKVFGDGGAIRNFYGNVDITNSKFIENYTDETGGAILNYGDMTIKDSEFTGNTADQYDGGAICTDKELLIENTIFKDNKTGRDAKSVRNKREGNLIINNCVFASGRYEEIVSDNTARISSCKFDSTDTTASVPESGFSLLNYLIKNERTIKLDNDIELESSEESEFEDGIKITSPNITIDGCGHKINAHGNARIFEIESTGITFKNIIFEGGYAKFGAAIETNRDTSCKIENCQFIKNKVFGDGGAIRNFYGDIVITDSKFIENYTDETGGAILNYGDMVIKDSEFTGNTADQYDGGAICSDEKLIIENSVFKDNKTGRDGKSIRNKREGKLTLNNCKFDENQSEEIVSDNTATVNGCEFDLINKVPDEPEIEEPQDGLTYTYLDKLLQFGSDKITFDEDIYLSNSEEDEFKNGIKIRTNDLTIDGNGHTIDARGKGRIFNITGENITLTNITFKNGSHKGFGGAIVVRGKIQLNNCRFENNHSEQGGAIKTVPNVGSRVEARGTKFIKNKAKSNIDSSSGNPILGGAICSEGDLELYGCEFNDNKSQEDGGSIFQGWNGTFRAFNTTFNRYKDDELFISDEDNVLLDNCEFKEGFVNLNNAKGLRSDEIIGSITKAGTSDEPADEGTFKSLQRLINGKDTEITLNGDINLESSEESDFSEGILIDKDNITIDGNNFKINANGKTPIFKITSKKVTIKNVDLVNAASITPAISNMGQTELIDCTIKDNNAKYIIVNGDDSRLTISGGEFIDNHSAEGGIYNEGECEIYNLTFKNNDSDKQFCQDISNDKELKLINPSFKHDHYKKTILNNGYIEASGISKSQFNKRLKNSGSFDLIE